MHKVYRLTPIPNELDAFHTVHGVLVEQRQDCSREEGPQGSSWGHALRVITLLIVVGRIDFPKFESRYFSSE